MNHGTKTTSKGTELPLLDLKGKPYLQVAHRLVWFREENPTATIFTELVVITPDYCVAKATVCDNTGKVVAMGHKREDGKSFADYVEKAETGAIGRALGAAGYGTQFEPSFDEGERLADSPISIPTTKVKETRQEVKQVKTPIKKETVPTININTKANIEAAYSRLKESGKTDPKAFKEKYLAGIPLSTMAPQIMEEVWTRITKDFPEVSNGVGNGN